MYVRWESLPRLWGTTEFINHKKSKVFTKHNQLAFNRIDVGGLSIKFNFLRKTLTLKSSTHKIYFLTHFALTCRIF